ncbi:MAG: GNAT family N-acetyltransferase [Chloroflexi bacterium]|nr:GNAT family N-acetyltransferase [Chloroflexota bacterium]
MSNLPDVVLRPVTADDLPILFEQQLDAEANWMSAFTFEDPSDRAGYMTHWNSLLTNKDIVLRAIEWRGQLAGYVLSFTLFGRLSVAYWLGREFWGKGIATAGLTAFLDIQRTRPIYARVAKDNLGSRRVLEKCGFQIIGEERNFANARKAETDELIVERRA